MATQKTWDYNSALADYNRPFDNIRKMMPQWAGLDNAAILEQVKAFDFMGENNPFGQLTSSVSASRSWNDILRDNAYQMVGQQAYSMTPQQLEQMAKQSGILGAKEQSFGETMMEGITGPLALPLIFTGAGMMNGAFSGAGAAGAAEAGAMSAAEMMNPALAGGGEVGSGYAASSFNPSYNSLFDADMLDWSLGPNSMYPAPWQAAAGAGSFAGNASTGASGAVGGGSGSAGPAAPAGTTAGGTSAGATVFDKVLSSPSILGAGAGALLGAFGGGSSPAGNTTTTEEMPDWLKAYAKPALDRYGTELQNYQIDPYGVMSSAGKQFSDTINGMYLTPESNKYLQDYFNTGAERVKGTLSPSFGHMQAFGSHTGYNEALARGLSDLATGIYGGAYENERNRQAQMTAAAPSFLTQQSQAAFAPYQSYLQTLSGLGKQKTQPYYDNPLGNILGGAMAGYGLGNIFK